jgi:hypothetical protein
MILYNVTVNIDDDIHADWLNWMQTRHIPDVLATGCFIEGRIFKILVEEQQGTSYSIQYRAASKQQYEHYRTVFASNLQKEHTERYNGKFVAFRTLLEEVEPQ